MGDPTSERWGQVMRQLQSKLNQLRLLVSNTQEMDPKSADSDLTQYLLPRGDQRSCSLRLLHGFALDFRKPAKDALRDARS